MSKVTGAWTSIHTHGSGIECLAAAFKRSRNTTIVIGCDQNNGTLIIDFDIQEDACRNSEELRNHLSLLLEALDGENLDDMMEER